MKVITDLQLVGRLAAPQGGVLTTSDLQTAFGEPHRAAFGRRVAALIQAGILTRFARGIFVTEDFDLRILSQRLAPQSCVSFETVLSAALVIGTAPDRRVVATKVGRGRRYRGAGVEVEHVSIAPHLFFGCAPKAGVMMARSEKAVLDALYFHLHGRRYAFDVYSDINRSKLDGALLQEYLDRYRNPKFITFAKRVLELS